ncbi:restriction endonuclease subunit S [Silvibacterium sp.]|uniref:restriction endonuclease subunit S n=1 Tax=Silvibacterium sp. TaxID=1964179 RepID=UPI0039E3868B
MQAELVLENPVDLDLTRLEPPAWEFIPLEKLAREITVGHVGPMADFYANSGIPFFRSLNVEPLRIVRQDLKFISEEFHSQLKKSALSPGDVAIVRTGKPGACAVVPDSFPIANCSDLVIVRCGEKIDPHFLAYFVNSAAKNHIAAHLVGAVQQHFNVGSARKLLVPLPSLNEQRLIVSVLRALDTRIEVLEKTNEALEAMARAIFKSWFVDFDPVRAKVEGREPEGMDTATAALFPSEFQDSEPGPIPFGWHLGQLSEIVAVNPSRTLRKGETAPYLDMSNVPTAGPSISDVVDRPLGSGCKFVNGDTLLAKITPCLENGKTAFVDFLQQNEVGWGSTELIVLAPIDPVPPVLGYLLARDTSFRSFAEQSMTGTSGRQRVPPDQLKRFGMVIADDTVYRAFGAVVTPMFDSITANAARMKTLSALRDTLLPRLISGKLRVPEAEAMLAEVL